jgi:predicted enzyme related to lactoylglutathione lyase
VADIEVTLTQATELGGSVLAPVTDMPGVGRFAVLADPTGAAFSVLQPADPGGPTDRNEVGRFSWHELWTSDPDAAWTFYRQLFGWVETGTMEMGPGVLYRMFGRSAEDMIGGMAPRSEGGPPSPTPAAASIKGPPA